MTDRLRTLKNEGSTDVTLKLAGGGTIVIPPQSQANDVDITNLREIQSQCATVRNLQETPPPSSGRQRLNS